MDRYRKHDMVGALKASMSRPRMVNTIRFSNMEAAGADDHSLATYAAKSACRFLSAAEIKREYTPEKLETLLAQANQQQQWQPARLGGRHPDPWVMSS